MLCQVHNEYCILQIFPHYMIYCISSNNAGTIWGWILFGGGHYYFHACSDTTLAPSDGAQTRVDTSCGWGVDLYRFFSTHRSFTTSTWTSLLHRWSLRASPSALLTASPTTWPGHLGVVRILIEGGYYFIQHRQLCEYYSRADSILRVGTIWGNIVIASMTWGNTTTTQLTIPQKTHSLEWISTTIKDPQYGVRDLHKYITTSLFVFGDLKDCTIMSKEYRWHYFSSLNPHKNFNHIHSTTTIFWFMAV